MKSTTTYTALLLILIGDIVLVVFYTTTLWVKSAYYSTTDMVDGKLSTSPPCGLNQLTPQCLLLLLLMVVDAAGRFDPPSGWKVLLAPESSGHEGPRSIEDGENQDWVPLGQSGGNPPVPKFTHCMRH